MGTSVKSKRAALASFVGTTIEWYDFYSYATAAAIVFGPLFFPGETASSACSRRSARSRSASSRRSAA